MHIPRNPNPYNITYYLGYELSKVVVPKSRITTTDGSYFSGSVVNKDAFGYSLTNFTDYNDSTNTFLDDYKSIELSLFLGNIYNSRLINTSRNLYNGSIKYKVTATENDDLLYAIPLKQQRNFVSSVLLRLYYKKYCTNAWLFEEQTSGEQYSKKSLDSVLKKDVKLSGIAKRVNTHWLRHYYETHLIESVTDLRYI